MRTTPRATPPFVAMRWDANDHHQWVTWLALVGLALALAMALFGLPPIDLHPPIHRLGIMDPLCGGTRSARLTAQGHWGQAWEYNPLGVVAVVGAGAALGRALVGLAGGRWVTIVLSWTPRRRRIVTTVVIVLVVALEIRQQLRADLLTAGT